MHHSYMHFRLSILYRLCKNPQPYDDIIANAFCVFYEMFRVRYPADVTRKTNFSLIFFRVFSTLKVLLCLKMFCCGIIIGTVMFDLAETLPSTQFRQYP